MTIEEARASVRACIDEIGFWNDFALEKDMIMAAADKWALDVLDEIHAAVCHPSAFAVAHGAKPTVHDIDVHAKIAEEHGIADEWVVARKRIKGKKHED